MRSFVREALGLGRVRWWAMCHLPAWPWKCCVVCGERFRRRPWWNANAFEEHCSRLCADIELAELDGESMLTRSKPG